MSVDCNSQNTALTYFSYIPVSFKIFIQTKNPILDIWSWNWQYVLLFLCFLELEKTTSSCRVYGAFDNQGEHLVQNLRLNITFGREG